MGERVSTDAPAMARAPDTTTAALDRVRRVAHVLDNAIPLPGGYRIGWDAVLGLVPGLGDSAGALLASYIVIEGIRMGAPRAVLARMVGNVLVEALVGAVPFFGDVFDAAYKANVRNVRLLERHLQSPVRARRASVGWIVAAVTVLVLLLAAVLTVAFLAIRGLARFAAGA